MEKETHKIKTCPKCQNKHIKVVLGEVGKWECDCGWNGLTPSTESVSYEEYLKFAEGEF